MEGQRSIRLMNNARCSRWADVVIRKRPQLLQWLSALHPQRLTCQVEEGFFHGSYNLGQLVTFYDGTRWLVRFPLVGHVSPRHADEKVSIEVKVMTLIRDKTTIPVPEIKHWGYTAENPLDLGPFIIMDFVDGVPLENLLSNSNAADHFRLIREDISDQLLEFLYRQFAQILLQLFQLDFDCIGSIPKSKAEFYVPIRPLTFKTHDILQTGGINTFGDRSKGFPSTTEYFKHVFDQDWKQLVYQPNSITSEDHGRMMFESVHALKTLIHSFVHPEYDKGKFKLICDDLSLANVIVRSPEDFTIVGLIDLEWSYIGPAQLFGSAPWWLLGIRLNSVDTNHEPGHPEMTARYLRYLEIYKRVLKEEEARMLGNRGNELSKLVEWSQVSGAMWLHMLLSCGFNHPDSLPYMQLRRHIGAEDWEQLKRRFHGKDGAFMKKKLPQLEQYYESEEWAMELEDNLTSGILTPEQFIAELAAL